VKHFLYIKYKLRVISNADSTQSHFIFWHKLSKEMQLLNCFISSEKPDLAKLCSFGLKPFWTTSFWLTSFWSVALILVRKDLLQQSIYYWLKYFVKVSNVRAFEYLIRVFKYYASKLMDQKKERETERENGQLKTKSFSFEQSITEFFLRCYLVLSEYYY